MFTPEQAAELKKKELTEEMKLLQDLEAKHGPNHPQVLQMKMEMGLITADEVQKNPGTGSK